MTDAPSVVDKLRGVSAVVTSQQNDATGRIPLGVSQSGLGECSVEWLPAISVLFQLQAVSGGARIDSTTENVPCQSVPHSGTAGDGGELECLLGGRNEDLCLVVSGDQNTCKVISVKLVNPII